MFHYFETRRAEQGNMVFIKVHGEAVCCQTIEEGGLMPQRDTSVCLQNDGVSFFFLMLFFSAPTPTIHTNCLIGKEHGAPYRPKLANIPCEALMISSRIPFMLCSPPAVNQVFSFTVISLSVCRSHTQKPTPTQSDFSACYESYFSHC